MSSRAIAPVVGVVSLLVVVAALGGVAAAVVPGSVAEQQPGPTMTIDLEADAGGNISFTHVGGASINVTELTVRIHLDGEAIPHQPDFEKQRQTGFLGFHGGPFNPSTDPEWRVGETASVTLANSNGAEDLTPGTLVTAEFYVEGALVLTVETNVSP